MWPSESQQSMLECERAEMLQNRCDGCSGTELEVEDDAAFRSRRFQTRLLRALGLMVVILIALLCLVLVLLAFVLLGHPVLLHRGQQDMQLHTCGPSKIISEQTPVPKPSVLLTKIVSDQPPVPKPPVLKPSALLTISQNVTSDYLEWQDKTRITRLQGGFVYNNRTLKVPIGGLYRVYLQVTFQYEENAHHNMCDDDTLALKITVESFSNSYRSFTSLLMSEDTMSCKKDWTKSMYTAGTYKLESDSLLRVKSLHTELILRQGSVFFGAEFQPEEVTLH